MVSKRDGPLSRSLSLSRSPVGNGVVNTYMEHRGRLFNHMVPGKSDFFPGLKRVGLAWMNRNPLSGVEGSRKGMAGRPA